MVSILINKNVFKPSYNDLKFIVRNRNYFFTNLISRVVKLPSCNCQFFLLCLLTFALYTEFLQCWVHTYLQLLYLLLGLALWSLYSVLLCLLLVFIKVYFVWFKYLLLQLSFNFHLHGIPLSLPFQSVCNSIPEVGLWYTAICMGLIVSMQPPMSLGGTFSLFTFKIVINMYILTAILLF